MPPSPLLAVLLTGQLAPAPAAPPPDWLVHAVDQPARVVHDERRGELRLENGLVRRVFRVRPDAATVALDDLRTGSSILRAVRPEARLTIDDRDVAVGGLAGQPDQGFLREDWIAALRPDPQALHFTGFESGPIRERLAWARVRPAPAAAWPPAGVELRLSFAPPDEVVALRGLTVTVHHECYQGRPLFAKWLTIVNKTGRALHLRSFTSEILAVVEAASSVENTPRWELPPLHVECEYAMHGMESAGANLAVRWVPDPNYATQVSYRLETPCLLEVGPPLGPDAVIPDGDTFTTFRTFVLVHDSTERERRGLAVRRMWRTIAPWALENPLLLHVRDARPEAVRLAIDQCAAVGFEMAILSFGSGFDAENESPEHRGALARLAAYARERNVELGGYSLLASRRIDDDNDVIDPATSRPGHAIFDQSPCLVSRWGDDYFRRLRELFTTTGLTVLEHDGSYPGDVCASTSHPGHRGLADSQWRQWQRIAGFYRWCRARGIYLNVPDWYFLSGSSKNGMGYRETNWSLPREQQLVHARQNIFDGTWEKPPSMGWMFVPLTEYHGGGAAATIEPLDQHLDAYEAHLANNLGLGVQACWRGPRLYDTERTRALVARWVTWFKEHRAILESDLIHGRRADGRDVDWMLHVNPALKERGLAMVYNPLAEPVRRTLRLPLYYTGLTDKARVRVRDGAEQEVTLDREYGAAITVDVPAAAATWVTIQ